MAFRTLWKALSCMYKHSIWSWRTYPAEVRGTARREQKWYVIESFLTKFVKW